MKRTICYLGAALSLFLTSTATADTIVFQTAIEQPTGASGSSVFDDQFVGTRFFVSEPTRTTAIGGHFGLNGLDVFGALVRLTTASDFPDSPDLSTPDVVGTARLTTPFGAWDARGLHAEPLAIDLQRGWYALVFGAGLFGAQRGGYLTSEHQQLGAARFFLRDGEGNYRVRHVYHPSFVELMFVRGESTPPAVPEPASVLFVGSGLAWALARRRQRALRG